MIYINHYSEGRYKVDPERVAANLKAGRIFVHPSSPEEWNRIIDILESDGFRPYDGYTKGEVLGSRFPLMILTADKTYHNLGNTTCAAAAAGSGLLVSEKEFYILYYCGKQFFQKQRDSALPNLPGSQ